MSREIIAVIPAAGVGSRMQANKPKQYLKILDKTILEHTLSVILSHPAINHVILAVGKNAPYLSEMTLFPHQYELIHVHQLEKVQISLISN